MKRPDLLAHSSPQPGLRPQPYEEHVRNVRAGARTRANEMVRFAAPSFRKLADAIDAATIFHDLGKLDLDSQATLAQGRAATLEWDHIDAGVAHLAAAGNWMSAWLVRGHHPPGLPELAKHFDKDGLGRKLRGRRSDDDDGKRHREQIARTDEYLANYLAAHESTTGSFTVGRMRAVHGLEMRLSLSCLVDADHSDSAAHDEGFQPKCPPSPCWKERLQSLDHYVSTLDQTGSADRTTHRMQFYHACRNSPISAPIVSCEGSVGIGKTTAVAAYLLQRAILDGLRRIFIVAPYTNIITQTVERLRLALTLPGENPEEVVAEHHHRADFSDRTSRALAVLWRAPIVVTTAVQFFETIASNNPAELRKLHALPGSAVFIDEAHAALPAHLWRQNWAWLRQLAEHWTCRFVLASGSLVRFWENPDVVTDPSRIPELLPPNLKSTFLSAERRRVRYRLAKHCETVNDLIAAIAQARGPRLVILNTVQSAACIADAMRRNGNDVLHLSTALAPRDRDTILALVAERLKASTENDWTLVATSCVEAGVDLSFRVAFRERFSTASLIQVGGRVNRHGGPYEASVFDFTIDEGDGITKHPGARYSTKVLKRQFANGAFAKDNFDPADAVSLAMVEEIRERGGFEQDMLVQAEAFRDYPGTRSAARVITSDTRLVVIDRDLAARLEQRLPVHFSELLNKSVQLWAYRIADFGLTPIPHRSEIYSWEYEYDPAFLGYMAGVLKRAELLQLGYAFI